MLLIGLLAPAAAQEPTTGDPLDVASDADETLTVDANGELLFIDPPAPEDAEDEPDDEPDAPAPEEPDAPIDEIVIGFGIDDQSAEEGAAIPAEFHLASLPGAAKTILLDFDGHRTVGTSWNEARACWSSRQ